jgi:hypothetical protein
MDSFVTLSAIPPAGRRKDSQRALQSPGEAGGPGRLGGPRASRRTPAFATPAVHRGCSCSVARDSNS